MGRQTESLASQIDGATDTFATSFSRVSGTILVWYDGLQIDSFEEPDARSIKLNFVPPLPAKRLKVEYTTDETVDGRVQGFPDDPTGAPATVAGDLQAELNALSDRIEALETAGAPPAATGGPAGGVLKGTYPDPDFADDATLPPSGEAGGDLEGEFPNPTIRPGALPSSLPPSGPATGDLDGFYPGPRIRDGVLPTKLPPTGPASGDLEGNYPSPRIRSDLIPRIPDSLPPSGPAGGDLDGDFPNPTLREGLIPSSLPPSGPASGDLDGEFPSPRIRAGIIPEELPPTGPAGGDLAGNFPNPTIRNGVIPNSLPPSGRAGGDLQGDYPNPTLAEKDATPGDLMGFREDRTWGPVPRSHQADAVPAGPAGGDLDGNYPDPTLARRGARNGDVLEWSDDAGRYVPGSGGGRLQTDYFSARLGNLVDGQTVFQLSQTPKNPADVRFYLTAGPAYAAALGFFSYDAGTNRITWNQTGTGIRITDTDTPRAEYQV